MFLNPNQQKAVEHFDGPCLCIAGPGSGKTAVLTFRIKKLIDRGVPADKILVITFTKAAAIEMKERFNKLSEESNLVTFGTFHSLFWGILLSEGIYKRDSLIMGARKLEIFKAAIKSAGIKTDDNDMVLEYLRCVEKMLFGSKDDILINENDLKKVAKNYSQLKDKYKVLDFEDMLTKSYELFLARPEVLKRWQERFSYLLIDEAQDMNKLQLELVKLLAGKHKNVFCVGDDDQSIYGFRGADSKVMEDFKESFDNCQLVVLDTNYRNPSIVVKAASSLIQKNLNRFEKNITATVDEAKLSINALEDSFAEAEFIVKEISKLKNEGENLDSIAVLYRNHTDARFLIESLIKNNIPFYLKEKMPNIYSHWIVDDIESLFQIAIGNATRKRMLSVINKPNRYVLRQAMEDGYSKNDLMKFYESNRQMSRVIEGFFSDINLLGKMSPFAAISYIMHGMGYENYLKEKALKSNTDISEYTDIVAFLAESFKDCKNIKAAIDKLNSLRLKVDYENQNKENLRENKVGLYTLHSSKGLEFKTVFIIGVNEGTIPSKKANSNEKLEAERRLFYVGITRTKYRLYLTYISQKNRDRKYPSRFINELNLDDYSAKSSS